MELSCELYFGDVLIFTDDKLYFTSSDGYPTGEESYLEYFDYDASNLKKSYAYNFICFLSQAWREVKDLPYKASFTKYDIWNLIENITDEKLKYFLYESCKEHLEYKYIAEDYTVRFSEEVVRYYNINPINEKLVNMELKLRK